jgi:hypothetical protein
MQIILFYYDINNKYFVTALRRSVGGFLGRCVCFWRGLYSGSLVCSEKSISLLFLFCLHIFTNLTSLLINWLGRYARIVDHLAVKTLPTVHHLEVDLLCTPVNANKGIGISVFWLQGDSE